MGENCESTTPTLPDDQALASAAFALPKHLHHTIKTFKEHWPASNHSSKCENRDGPVLGKVEKITHTYKHAGDCRQTNRQAGK